MEFVFKYEYDLTTIWYNNKEYMKVDDVIGWLKMLQENLPKEYESLLHFQIKGIVKMKNSPIDKK